MAKIVVAGNALVITSSKTFSEIRMLERYNPEALRLYEPSKDGTTGSKEIFRVATSLNFGEASKYGIMFDSVTRDEASLASVTIIIPKKIPQTAEATEEWIQSELGPLIIYLNEVEANMDAALEETYKIRDAISEAIEYL